MDRWLRWHRCRQTTTSRPTACQSAAWGWITYSDTDKNIQATEQDIKQQQLLYFSHTNTGTLRTCTVILLYSIQGRKVNTLNCLQQQLQFGFEGRQCRNGGYVCSRYFAAIPLAPREFGVDDIIIAHGCRKGFRFFLLLTNLLFRPDNNHNSILPFINALPQIHGCRCVG